MSLINEALKRAEAERRRHGGGAQPEPHQPASLPDTADQARGEPGPPELHAGPFGRPPSRGRGGLRAALILATFVIAGVGLMTYLSLPAEDKPPASVQAEPTPSSSAGTGKADPAGHTTHAEPGHRAITPSQQRPQALFPYRNLLLKTLAEMQRQSRAMRPPRHLPQPSQPQPTSPPPVTTRPAVEPTPAVSFRLGGILQSGNEAHALINNHLVKVGDEIDGARVVAIGKYHVVLEKDGKRITLRM